jgi:hypothetical protein
MEDFMRIYITSLFILLFCIAGVSLCADADDGVYVPDRMGPGEWIGKGVGRVVDATVSQAWNWATDARYDGLTKLRRFGAIGCFACAAGCLITDVWRERHNGNRGEIPKRSWRAGALAAVGFLLTLRPEPVYTDYSF